ncbi:type IV pilus secretin PilQ [Alginatibacterium sediminis]|uniref:Type IV pilus secretin PilQ n=1 Tax=Alginatibacterium sediminis TaxID=2164068 RepID=A0A420EL65_9ALTE|nr:type IV pilus secretin PilQ [Alginatibacterium sediminis]RKF21344.1 type IV pilus secretin PilQ [Alginatibacterium sediminis]
MNNKSRYAKRICLAWLGMCLSVSAFASVNLVSLNSNSKVKGALELELVFDGPVGELNDRLEYQPNQLIVDVSDASSNLKMNPLPIDSNGVTDLQTRKQGNNLQLVFQLERLVPYQLKKDGNRILMQVGAMPALAATPTSQDEYVAKKQAEPKTVSQNFDAQKAAAINSVTAIDFRRGKGGAGQLLLSLKNNAIASDIQRRDNKLLVDLINTDIADELVYLLDVSDFGTPVSQVEVFRYANKVHMELSITGDYDYRYDQSKGLLLVEVKQQIKTAKTDDTVVYQGKPISLNFQNIPVRTVLQIIADFNKLNLVTTDSVAGNITLRLDDVPWEQALDIILKVKGLDKRLENNILLVAPAAELAEQERQSLENKQQVADLSPLYSEYIQVNYAKASAMSALLSGESSSLLSERGTVTVDERTNTLLVKDTEASILAIKRMLSALDVAVEQVVIEARMVSVLDTNGLDLGVEWNFSSTETSNGNSGDFNVNLPIGSPAGSLALQIGSWAGGVLDLELTALEQVGQGEIIASPRITTANQQTAYIEQGSEIPYNESSSSGATSVAFIKAVLSLEVTPQITPDGKLILDLKITQDSPGETVNTGTGTAIAIETQRIETQVLVDNGETIVLGGIYQQTSINSVSKFPVLGDIPGVGALFRTTSESIEKRELLIFVTPKIIVEQF